ncbi:MAG: hypothetical protein R2799_07715 [Crocinitomicaceae bacterium]
MKKLLLLPFLVFTLYFTSCEKDPAVIFPGTWSVESGGTFTFNADGTGYSLNTTQSMYQSSCALGDTSYFTWTATPNSTNNPRGTLRMDFLYDDMMTSCGYLEIAYKIKSKTKVQLGANVLGFDLSDDITKQ